MRKLSIVTLLFMGISLSAADPVVTGNEGSTLVQGKRTERNIIKVKSALFSGSSYMREEETEPHGPGLFLNISAVIPSEGYMDPFFGNIYHNGTKYKTGAALEIGNYFRFFHTDRLGLGVRATWISVGYTYHQDTAYSEGNAFGSPLRVGPQLSYLIGEEMGIDAFYQLGAQYNIDWYREENLSFAGISHELGAAVRYSIFTLGAAYKFGSLRNVDTSDPKTLPKDEVNSYPVTSFRIFVGFQL